MITLTELTTRLGLDDGQADELIRAGMPRSGAMFDEAAVRAWLIDNGYATEAAIPAKRTIEDIERDDVARAREKLDAGEKLTRSERSILKRAEKEQEAEDRRRLYKNCPKADYEWLSGRQRKVINEQAVRYGIPMDGRTCDLQLVIKGFHDLIARNRHKLSEDGPAQAGDPSLTEYRTERAAMARMDRLEREGQLMPRTYVLDGLTRIATIIRGLGDQLARDYDDEARLLLDAAIDDAEREIETMFGDKQLIE